MCVFDETGAKSLLYDEIFVATGRTPLSAKVFGDVGGRLQARSAFQRAFVSVCLRDGSAYAGRRRQFHNRSDRRNGRLCVRGGPTAWRDPKDGCDVGGVRRIRDATAWRALRSRGPGHWLHNRRAIRRCVPAYRLPSGAARGYTATIVGGSVSERPKVQHSKCCVVNSHRGFKSRRYRHNRFMRTLVME